MTRIEEAMLQLKADLEELKEYSIKSAYEYDASRKLSEKIIKSLLTKLTPIEEFDFNTVSVLFEEQQKKLREMIHNEIRIITRVSPKLETYFEESVSRFEKQHQQLMNQFNGLIENPNWEDFRKWSEHVKKHNKVEFLINDIQISRQIIEDILKRFEQD